MYPMALMWLSPLPNERTASLPCAECKLIVLYQSSRLLFRRFKRVLLSQYLPWDRKNGWNWIQGKTTVTYFFLFYHIILFGKVFHCTKMYPMALISPCSLSGPLRALLPHVLAFRIVPNPIHESHESQLLFLLPTIPILALKCLDWLQTALNPSLLQFLCNKPCEPINSFHLSRPSEVLRYCPSAISEYRESACLWITMNLSCWSIFIPRQILEKDVFQ